MNELRGSKQDEQMEELLVLLESMQSEADQREKVIWQQHNEIKTLQEQLNESLNLCEKLNTENKAENVQALKNDLRQTRELLQSEKEKGKRADLTIEEYRDKLRQAEQDKEYALAHQKTVEILVEKPLLYERCQNCDRRAYQKAKERYEDQRNRLEKQYQAKTVGFHAVQIVLWWYASVTTLFAAMRSEVLIDDAIISARAVWKVLCMFGQWLMFEGQYVAGVSNKLSNEKVAVIVYWLLRIVVILGVAVVTGALLFMMGKRVVRLYQESCMDIVSAIVTVTSVAVAVYFGDWIKAVVGVNLVVLLLLVQAVYVGIRTYVNGCKRARGYY